MMDLEKIDAKVLDAIVQKDLTLDVESIKELIEMVSRLEIADFELETPMGYLRISKYPETVQVPAPPPPPSVQAPPPPPPPPHQNVAPPPQEEVAPAPEEPAQSSEELHEIKSPIVGTFYRAPAPGEAPFVEVGDHVNPGDVLCIVEAMKVMNQIKSDISGTIAEILPKNGEPVEYGQVLFRIKPD